MSIENLQSSETVYEKMNGWAQEVEETSDSFIFHVLSNFASINYDITIEKDELVKAIQIIRMRREYGEDICKDLDTAVKNSEFYRKAYCKGFEDGVEITKSKIMNSLNEDVV